MVGQFDSGPLATPHPRVGATRFRLRRLVGRTGPSQLPASEGTVPSGSSSSSARLVDKPLRATGPSRRPSPLFLHAPRGVDRSQGFHADRERFRSGVDRSTADLAEPACPSDPGDHPRGPSAPSRAPCAAERRASPAEAPRIGAANGCLNRLRWHRQSSCHRAELRRARSPHPAQRREVGRRRELSAPRWISAVA